MKTDKNDLIKREVTANIIDSDEVTFLCGEETLMKWNTTLDFAERKLGFKENDKAVELIKRSHLLVKLELVGKWKDEDVVLLLKEEKDVNTLKAVQRIHKILNHKQKKQMYYTYENAGKLDTETRKLIDEVIENCEICKKNSRSK